MSDTTTRAAADNRAIIARFADLFYGQKDVEAAFSTYVAPDYIQHNPGIADERDAAVAALKPLFAREDQSFSVQRILGDGEFAAIHIRVKSSTPPGNRGAAVVDRRRVVCAVPWCLITGQFL